MTQIDLTFSQYQKATDSTAIYGQAIARITRDKLCQDILRRDYVALGLGEVGELQGKIKKIIRDSEGILTPETKEKLAGELGDVIWYVARMATELNLDLGEVAMANLAKLESRKDRGTLQGSGDNR